MQIGAEEAGVDLFLPARIYVAVFSHLSEWRRASGPLLVAITFLYTALPHYFD